MFFCFCVYLWILMRIFVPHRFDRVFPTFFDCLRKKCRFNLVWIISPKSFYRFFFIFDISWHVSYFNCSQSLEKIVMLIFEKFCLEIYRENIGKKVTLQYSTKFSSSIIVCFLCTIHTYFLFHILKIGMSFGNEKWQLATNRCPLHCQV